MDFFEHQDRAHRRTWLLIFCYTLAIAALVASANLVAFGICRVLESSGNEIPIPQVLWAVTFFNLALILGGTFWRVMQLRTGGRGLAGWMGAKAVDASTTDEAEIIFRNTAQEMAIAAGMAMPELFVLEKGKSINAFAAGWSAEDAAIVVTRGALAELNREELQGVLAHEFSHIVNSDSRLNLQMLGVLNGIMWVGAAGRGMLRVARHGKAWQLTIGLGTIGLVMTVLGYLGALCGRIIQFAVAREREYLADASAAQFTRHPVGLASALSKVVFHPAPIEPLPLVVAGQSLNHMAFAPLTTQSFFATHPPLEDRIDRLHPGCDPKSLIEEKAWKRWRLQDDSIYRRQLMKGYRRQGPEPASIPQAPALPGLAPGVASSVGSLTPEHLVYSHSLIGNLSPSVLQWVSHPEGASGLAYALFLSHDHNLALEQIRMLKGRKGADRIAEFQDALVRGGPKLRLPLAELALPILKRLDAPTRQQMLLDFKKLAEADGTWVHTEFLYWLLFKVHMEGPKGVPQIRPANVLRQREAIVAILGFVARVGAADHAEQAYLSACKVMELPLAYHILPKHLTLEAVQSALEVAKHSSPADKRRLLEACVTCVEHDGEIGVSEAETIRVLSETLSCPMPPILKAA